MFIKFYVDLKRTVGRDHEIGSTRHRGLSICVSLDNVILELITKKWSVN